MNPDIALWIISIFLFLIFAGLVVSKIYDIYSKNRSTHAQFLAGQYMDAEGAAFIRDLLQSEIAGLRDAFSELAAEVRENNRINSKVLVSVTGMASVLKYEFEKRDDE